MAKGSANRPGHQLKIEAWPIIDRELWMQAMTPGDIFDDPRPAAKWRSATQTTVSKAYGGWLGWLVARGALDATPHPMERATPELLGEYVAHLRATTAPGTVASYLQAIAMALNAMLPDAKWDWLWAAVNLANRARRVNDEKRHRIVSVEDLHAFGYSLIGSLPTGNDLMDAVRYRDGLMVLLLASRPIRVNNLQMMQIGQHLVRVGRRFYLRFAGEEVKNHTAIDMPLPQYLTEVMEIYLQIHRPVLLAAAKKHSGGNALWITRFGTAMGGSVIYHRIAEITCKRFGRPINPHLFRDCVATTASLNDPENLGVVMNLLGHRSSRTSERYYIHAQTKQAVSLYHSLTTEIRRDHERGERQQRLMQMNREN